MGNGNRKDAIDSKYLKPNGLYNLEWDLKVVKKMILERKIAPFYPGKDNANELESEECPICFLNYTGGLNRTKCCKKGICTECHLMIKKPTSEASCPFCNRTGYIIEFTGPLSKEERDVEFREQQKVVELQIKMRQEEIEKDKEREKQRELARSKSSQAGEAAQQPPSVPGVPLDASNKPAGTSDSVRTSRSSLKNSRRKDKHKSNERREDQNEPPPLPASPAVPVVPMVPESVSTSMDNESNQEDFVSHMISAFNAPRGGEALETQDLEELMIMEAIRRSLSDAKPPEPKTKPSVKIEVGSPAKSDITSSTNTNSTTQSGQHPLAEPKDEELEVSETLTNSSFSTNYTNTTTAWEANQHPSLHSDAEPSNLTGLSDSISDDETEPKKVSSAKTETDAPRPQSGEIEKKTTDGALVDIQVTAKATIKPKKEKKDDSSSSEESSSSSSSSESDSSSASSSAEVLLKKSAKNPLKNLPDGILNTETRVQ